MTVETATAAQEAAHSLFPRLIGPLERKSFRLSPSRAYFILECLTDQEGKLFTVWPSIDTQRWLSATPDERRAMILKVLHKMGTTLLPPAQHTAWDLKIAAWAIDEDFATVCALGATAP